MGMCGIGNDQRWVKARRPCAQPSEVSRSWPDKEAQGVLGKGSVSRQRGRRTTVKLWE